MREFFYKISITILLIFVLTIISILVFLIIPEEENGKGYMATLIDKHELLRKSELPSMIFVGGSNVVYSIDSQMIENKLFSIAGLEQEIHKNENVQRLLKWHEKEAVIRELYKDEVGNQVSVSENETQEAFILTNQRLFLRQFIFQTKDKRGS